MAPLSTKNLNRGDRYATDNSTIPRAADVAATVGVKPPDEVPARAWKRAWLVLKFATPFLHLFDRDMPPNSSLNLYCLWWKALAGNDKDSPVFDDSLSFDILPRGTRWIVAKPNLYPRLHHANVEIRTAFIDRSVTSFAEENRNCRIRLVSLGAGYDVRSIKLKERQVIDRAYELDLAEVVRAKQRIFTSKRFQRRRPNITVDALPTFYSVDLNDLVAVRKTLKEILCISETNDSSQDDWHTIFLFEAVMIYLNDGIPRALLQACSEALKSTKSRGSLVFADRLENVPGGDRDIGTQELASLGWNVVEWLPKPGLARHMGRAVLLE